MRIHRALSSTASAIFGTPRWNLPRRVGPSRRLSVDAWLLLRRALRMGTRDATGWSSRFVAISYVQTPHLGGCIHVRRAHPDTVRYPAAPGCRFHVVLSDSPSDKFSCDYPRPSDWKPAPTIAPPCSDSPSQNCRPGAKLTAQLPHWSRSSRCCRQWTPRHAVSCARWLHC